MAARARDGRPRRRDPASASSSRHGSGRSRRAGSRSPASTRHRRRPRFALAAPLVRVDPRRGGARRPVARGARARVARPRGARGVGARRIRRSSTPTTSGSGHPRCRARSSRRSYRARPSPRAPSTPAALGGRRRRLLARRAPRASARRGDAPSPTTCGRSSRRRRRPAGRARSTCAPDDPPPRPGAGDRPAGRGPRRARRALGARPRDVVGRARAPRPRERPPERPGRRRARRSRGAVGRRRVSRRRRRAARGSSPSPRRGPRLAVGQPGVADANPRARRRSAVESRPRRGSRRACTTSAGSSQPQVNTRRRGAIELDDGARHHGAVAVLDPDRRRPAAGRRRGRAHPAHEPLRVGPVRARRRPAGRRSRSRARRRRPSITSDPGPMCVRSGRPPSSASARRGARRAARPRTRPTQSRSGSRPVAPRPVEPPGPVAPLRRRARPARSTARCWLIGRAGDLEPGGDLARRQLVRRRARGGSPAAVARRGPGRSVDHGATLASANVSVN